MFGKSRLKMAIASTIGVESLAREALPQGVATIMEMSGKPGAGEQKVQRVFLQQLSDIGRV